MVLIQDIKEDSYYCENNSFFYVTMTGSTPLNNVEVFYYIYNFITGWCSNVSRMEKPHNTVAFDQEVDVTTMNIVRCPAEASNPNSTGNLYFNSIVNSSNQQLTLPFTNNANPPCNLKDILIKDLKANTYYVTEASFYNSSDPSQWTYVFIESMKETWINSNRYLISEYYYVGSWIDRQYTRNGDSRSELIEMDRNNVLIKCPYENLKSNTVNNTTNSTKVPIPENAKSQKCVKCGEPTKEVDTGFSIWYYCPDCEP